MNASSGLEFLDLHPFVRATVADKLRGVIVGSALGDCIGLYTEFLSSQSSWEAYPSAKFQLVAPATPFKNDSHRNKFTTKSWTDDTDHALLIVLSYLHNDGKLVPDHLAARLRIWVEQGLRCLNRLPLGLGRTVGRVVLDKDYLSDPTLTAHKFWVAGDHNAAPNGSLMRTHPLGLICLGKTIEETFRIATAFSLVTHADTRCVLACCISSALIRGILRGEVRNEKDVDALIDTSFTWVDGWQKRGRKYEEENQPEDEWIDASTVVNDSKVNKVEDKNNHGEQKPAGPQQQQKPEPSLDRLELYRHTYAADFISLQLDDSMKMGYVYKSLGAAILSLRLAMRSSQGGQSRYPPPPSQDENDNKDLSQSFSRTNVFETIITSITMAGGDADTNACAAGALLGAWLGHTALPANWKDGIEHREWLIKKCDALGQTIGVISNSFAYKGSEDPDTRADGGRGFLDKAALERREMAFMEAYLNKGTESLEAKKERKGWKEKLFSK